MIPNTQKSLNLSAINLFKNSIAEGKGICKIINFNSFMMLGEGNNCYTFRLRMLL
jgi:hypothetical protein